MKEQWFKLMFPQAESEDDLIPLYSVQTAVGIWQISTPVLTFRCNPYKETAYFFSSLDTERAPKAMTSVFAAIKYINLRTTSIDVWDESALVVSDYLKDWKCEVSDRVRFNYIDYWMRKNPHENIRQMVDYFEHDDTYLLERISLGNALKEMIVSGQLDHLPTIWMPPSEFSDVIRVAEDYGIKLDRSK